MLNILKSKSHSVPKIQLQMVISHNFFCKTTYQQGFHYYWLINFPDFSSIFPIFQYNFFQIFPVLAKFSDWKMLSHFLEIFQSEWEPRQRVPCHVHPHTLLNCAKFLLVQPCSSAEFGQSPSPSQTQIFGMQ